MFNLIIIIFLCIITFRIFEYLITKSYESNKLIVNFACMDNDDINIDIGYKKIGDSGMDIRSAEEVTIPAGGTKIVSTKLMLDYLDPECEIQVRPRSGLAFKEGITVLNTPGTVDSGYRNELKVILYNTSYKPITLSRGYRIAQLVIMKVVKDKSFLRNKEERGKGGFGSTGTH